jgi:hypothetical protein
MSKATANKQKIITFKTDEALLDALRGVDNRSEFIRLAVLAALDNICPLCGGRGLLTPNQKRHWNTFAADHGLEECDHCHELYLVCHSGSRRRPRRPHRRAQPRRDAG